MRVLQLCKKFPYPLKDGESIAVNSLSKALTQHGCEITLLAMNTKKHYAKVPKSAPELDHFKNIHTVYVDNTLNPVDAFLNLISGKSYNISRFDSKEFRNKLIELLQTETFDIIQLETSYLSVYIDTIKEYSDAHVVLRSHNLEYEIWERIADNTKRGLKSWYLNKCAERLFEFELASLDNYDLLVSITDQDLTKYRELGYKKRGISSPAGLNLNEYKDKQLKKNPSISFIGSLDWMPNLNGLQWFVENVWPEVVKRNPDLKFHIAGRNLDKNIGSFNAPNIVLEGEVDCAKAFISDHNIMVVPLFSGSGIRVKILEGLALGRTIISTTVGAEGIAAVNGEHLLLADDVQQFVEAIQYCLREPSVVNDFSRKGRELIKDRYDNLENTKQLVETYRILIGKSSTKFPKGTTVT